jgi:hypothetical protein
MYIKSTRQAVLDKGRYSTKVKAVVMSCLGDRNLLGHDKYVQVELKADHYAFDVNCTKISGAISLPIATYILPADEAWRRSDGSAGLGFNPYENREITFMHMDISAVDDHWGFANMREWDIRVGSVLVVRKDKKDLTIHHVEAHAVYCSTVLRDHVRKQLDAERSREIGGHPMTQAEKRNGRFHVICGYMNKAAFSDFFEDMKKEKIAAGFRDWASATNPYNG